MDVGAPAWDGSRRGAHQRQPDPERQADPDAEECDEERDAGTGQEERQGGGDDAEIHAHLPPKARLKYRSARPNKVWLIPVRAKNIAAARQ